MGASASKSSSSSSSYDNDSPPCFSLFCPPQMSKKTSDALGSPMPTTPLDRLRHRKTVMQEAYSNPIYLFRNGGLEKDRSDEWCDMLPPPPTNEAYCQPQPPQEAEIHEADDAEQHFYAKYEILEVLGVGSTSTCHRCIHKELKEDFACKIIDKRQLEERFQGLMAQFQTEIQALRSLQHPNIIRLYDVYISPNHIFIVMELMEGGELFDYVVQKGTLTEEEASRIVRKVTSALVYMHSKNIIHRDMKPENLLLKHQPSPRMGGDLDLEVKIIDFGLSKCMEESVARSFLGTRGYLAPEMLQRREYSRAVDTWALGVIVFVLLCGCLPFDDDSQTVPSDDLVRLRFVLRFPRWAKTLSASAKDLLNHLLDVNPHTRYTAEQALKHPWVTGEQAPKENLLQSPGRIKTTPKRTERGREYDMIPPKVTPTTTLLAPKRNVVRKTSF